MTTLARSRELKKSFEKEQQFKQMIKLNTRLTEHYKNQLIKQDKITIDYLLNYKYKKTVSSPAICT